MEVPDELVLCTERRSSVLQPYQVLYHCPQGHEKNVLFWPGYVLFSLTERCFSSLTCASHLVHASWNTFSPLSPGLLPEELLQAVETVPIHEGWRMWVVVHGPGHTGCVPLDMDTSGRDLHRCEFFRHHADVHYSTLISYRFSLIVPTVTGWLQTRGCFQPCEQ